GGNYTCKVVISQDYIGCLLCNIGAAPHGNAYICLSECRGIVNTVPCHCNDFILVLKYRCYSHLMFRDCPCKYQVPVGCEDLLKFPVTEFFKVTAPDDGALPLNYPQFLAIASAVNP